MAHKAGYVNIVGNPNVGKSTLMNALIGERLSIITSKAQTTRHRILGIWNDEDHQIVFSDTPGIIKPSYALQKEMMTFANSALLDADVLVLMASVKEKELKDEVFLERIQKLNIPILVVLNKIDLSDQTEVVKQIDSWMEKLPNAEVFPISALEKFNTEAVMNRIQELLPEGEPFFDKDAITDRPERFFVSEIIREKILMNYQKEVPYSVEIEVESFKEEEDIIRMNAVIYVSRDSQKGIIIGHKGQEIKRVGTAARYALEKFFQKKVFLELFVKVNKDWRDDERQLKRFGYQQ